MTTASLSGLLTRVGALTDADVRELEKLADSYPYCQTAHLLLAKALHDRGSVLAGQKLRRAATGAPDRRALRHLLLTPPSELLTEAPAIAGGVEVPILAVSAAGELVAHEAAAPPTDEVAPPDTASLVAAAIDRTEDTADDPRPAAEALTPAEMPIDAATESARAVAEVASLAGTPLIAGALPPDAVVVELPAAIVLADFDLVPDTSPATVELLLFEADENATPAGLSLLAAEATTPPAVPMPALAPDLAVAYWLPTSRFGPELTAADFAPTTADGVSEAGPVADLTAPWLPLAPPDARWTEHVAAHQPARPLPAERRPFDHQFALIERFLRERPRLRAVDPTRPLPEKLPDLAQKSTRADEKGVVSESMARILARQGKTARAVAMYEQLQARLPEKAAIFAAQIAALRGPAATP
ncbi:MAG: hypothetical protein H7330_13965 [Hymenobacteraceae bacterium]|nr:hypothetical protein [Hymenobacteraceae bacterium]